jgi:hypothetical protein
MTVMSVKYCLHVQDLRVLTSGDDVELVAAHEGRRVQTR